MSAPHFFSTKEAFRKFLSRHYKTETELLVGYYKKDSGKPSITWPESVDVALCFGWIDGVRKTIDDTSYMIRFTSRKPGSVWSAVNIAKAEALIADGQMKPEGLAAFERRKEERSRIYSHESGDNELAPGYLRQLKGNKEAWAFFLQQAPSYQKAARHWIMTAKQEVTQKSRLAMLIADSAAGKRVKPLSYAKKKE